MDPNQYYQQPGQQPLGASPGIDPSSYPGITPPPQAPPIDQGKPSKANPKALNSTQNMLEIAEIRDGIVIMNDGSFRSVVMIKPINFDLMSNQEREAVEFAYQGFLNSLYFPVQVFIHSERVDINPYLNQLDRTRQNQDNMLLAVLTEDYINFMVQLAAQTNIMEKRFYLIIPYFPIADIQKAITQSKNFFTGMAQLLSSKQKRVVINEPDLVKAKDELKNRVQAALAALMQCGIQGIPLDTRELIELYYNTYNPDTSTRQGLRNFEELNATVVSKGEGVAPQPNISSDTSRGVSGNA